MKELIELIDKFEVSRPIFKLTLNSAENGILVEVIHRYAPKPNDDFLSELVCANFEEKFNMEEGVFRIDKHDLAERAMRDIRGFIYTFLEKNLEMKNPRQSKLCRWYNNSNAEIDDVIVMVYKYIRPFTDSRGNTANEPHAKNTIAVLEAIMEKHEQK